METELPNNVVSVNFSRSPKDLLDLPEVEIPVETLEKRVIFSEFLESGIVSVAFDPRVPATKVPSQFKSLTDMVLNFSYGYRISDFGFDDVGISATLSFPEGYFGCFVPWNSVFSLHSEPMQKSSFWPEDAPKELQVDAIDAIAELVAEAPTPKKTPHLSLVRDD